MALDYKKEQKALYRPKTVPSVIDVPMMNFIAVDGVGNPNTSAEYTAAVALLYGLSYTIKMSHKAILEYVVAPLEGLWWHKSGGVIIDITDKDSFAWTSLIRQPEFVTADIFEEAKTAIARKKPTLKLSKARLIQFTEGLCAQIMHIGSYDDEHESTSVLESYIDESGYITDFTANRRHHEIYLSDPRKTAPEKLKTIIRYPILRRRCDQPE